MTKDLRPRVLALAGMLQALKLVRQIAETGHAESALETCVLDSVFRIDADSADAVYGGAVHVRQGLLLLRGYLYDKTGELALQRLAMALMQIERRFVDDQELPGKVLTGIAALSDKAERQSSSHPDVIAGLGRLYADTISQLRPKVIVQGNPHYLQQANIVAEIRALLLAGLRSAVLWRQMGGSYWDFALRRRPMMQVIEAELG